MSDDTSSVLSKRACSTDWEMASQQSSKTAKLDQDASINAAACISFVDKLEALIATFYPQYALVRYMPIRVEKHEGSIVRWRCKLHLFEMLLECRKAYISLEEAKEAVARTAIDLLTEFNIVIRSRSTDARFGQLFQPLLDEMTKSLVNSSMLDPIEEEKIALGHEPVLSVEKYKDLGSLSLQKSVLSANLSAIYEKMTSTGMAQTNKQQAPVQVNQKATKSNIPSSNSYNILPVGGDGSELMDPLSAIHVHYQKRAGSCEAPDFQIFEGKSKMLFGCIGKYDGKNYIAEGIYKTKKDAKRAAAVLICQDIFGANCPVAVAGVVVGSTNAVVANFHGISREQSNEKINPAPERLSEAPPVGKRFVSLVNECCQVHRLSQPDYQCKTGESISNFFILHALNTFDPSTIQRLGGSIKVGEELPRRFVSAAFTKKMDAKEDCAARIYAFLRDCGVFSLDGNLTKRNEPSFQAALGNPYYDNGGGRSEGYQGNRHYNNSQQQYQMMRAPPVQALPAWPPSFPLPMVVPPMPPFPFPMIPPAPGQQQQQMPGMFPPFPPMPHGMPSPPHFMFPPMMAPPASSPWQSPQAPAPTKNVQDPRLKRN